MFESLYICTNIFYMVTKINCETYTWIVNTMIEFLPLNFPPKLKTIVYICLNVLIDDMSWKIRCNSFSPPASAIILIIYGISSRYTDNLRKHIFLEETKPLAPPEVGWRVVLQMTFLDLRRNLVLS